MEKNNNFIDLYFVEDEYDGHSINDMIKTILNIECEQERLYKGKIFSVENEKYYDALKFVTSELLRREPNSEVNWIDESGKQRPYNEFCYGILKLKDEYKDDDVLPMVFNQITRLFAKRSTLDGSAPISANMDDNGYIYLEGDIRYNDQEKFWHDLRVYGLSCVFAQRRKFCSDMIANYDELFKIYTDEYYKVNLDGSVGDSFDMQTELTLTDKPIQKIKI